MALPKRKSILLTLRLAAILSVCAAICFDVSPAFAKPEEPPDTGTPAEIDGGMQGESGQQTDTGEWVSEIVQSVTNFVFDTSSLFDLLNSWASPVLVDTKNVRIDLFKPGRTEIAK